MFRKEQAGRFREITWPNPGSEFVFGVWRKDLTQHRLDRTLVQQVPRKEWAKPWFGRIGVHRNEQAEPLFGGLAGLKFGEKQDRPLVCQVWKSEKGTGQTLVQQVRSLETAAAEKFQFLKTGQI